MSEVIGIDLGGTGLRAARIDSNGRVLGMERVPTDARGGPEAVVAQIMALVAKLRSDAVYAVGLAMPGPIDTKAGIALAPPTLHGWRDVPIADLLSRRIGLPAVVENDGNAAALGEWHYGAGRGVDNLVYVTVSTGIGGGIIVDRHLLRGLKGLAGEIGHMTISESDATCSCGNRGCFEALASGTALGRRAGKAVAAASKSCLASTAGKDLVTARHVEAAARQGDPLALQLISEEAALLGIGFANLQHLYSPEIIVVGGGVSACLDLMADTIEKTMRSRIMAGFPAIPVIPAALGDAAGLVGAAVVAEKGFAAVPPQSRS